VIYAFEHAGPEDRERLARLYRNGDTSDGDVDEVIAILERTGAREFTRTEARRYRDEALAELDAAGVIDGEARVKLEGIIVSVITA
jgi:geranylgeranyl pyrophosphate synthase